MGKIDPEEPRQVHRGSEQFGEGRVAAYLRTKDPQKEAVPKRAAIYARTALSQNPAGENSALDDQIRQCKQYCQERGYTVDERHIYSEIGRGSMNALKHRQFVSLLQRSK